MSFKKIEYTKLEIESDEESRTKPISQQLNADFDNVGQIKSEVEDDIPAKSPVLWSFSYYQRLFDIDTTDVLTRILHSFVPNPRKSFLQNVINSKPDLYGPFWTCTTLILTLAITGNIASYFQSSGKAGYWNYDFKKLSLAAITIYTYWWLMPLIIWGICKIKKVSSTSFLELLTLYGYSLTIYIPISVFWVVQITWLQWLLVMVALALSGVVLANSVWTAHSVHHRQVSVVLTILVTVMHAILSVGFMLYFFHVPGTRAPLKNTSKSF